MNKYIYRSLFALGLLSLTATSCSDEIKFDTPVEEGLPTEITVKVSLPDMKSVSRFSEIAGDVDKEVNSLWIGIYNATTGEQTGSYTGNAQSATPDHTNMESVTLKTKTGRSYIVAVANYAGRSVHNGTSIVTAESALAEAVTWEKFKELSAMFSTNGNINSDVPLNALLMSGHYISTNHANGDHTALETVSIPLSGNLPGAIHLRRLISQIKFNVKYDQTKIKNFEVQSWQVKNVPNQSWLYEQEDAAPLNVGDSRRINDKESYQDSEIYTQTEQNTTTKTWSFDWWQLENKRTGLEPAETYNKDGDYYSYREVEYKDNALNTGKYQSLVSSATSDDANNNATFVELKVRMELTVDENGNALTGGQTRMADCVYTIHLGYCEGNGKAKAMDFNCRRNTKYTYTVTINNINDILVEARSNTESAPGAEGTVSDVTDQFVELDAHYGVYNIYLSATDLDQFDYMINCYDENSNLKYIDSTVPSTVPAENSTDRKYLDWVEISPTSEGIIATYNRSNTNQITLDQFKEKVVAGTATAGWYTLFFNEYVYYDSNSQTSNWHEYVNKPDRQVWLRIKLEQSADKESAHYVSKYAFAQKSIQTYYNETSATALGIEHTNESYGLNLRNNFNTTAYGANSDNGRYNVAQYIANSTDEEITFEQDDRFLWSGYVKNSLQTVAAISNTNMNVTEDARTKDNPYPVPALATLSGQTSNTADPDQSSSPQYIEAINACMNRNRDLDGNGYIDANELRWYIPTANIYTRMILGRRSLATPIMNYSAYPELNYYNTERLNGAHPNLMLYGSDGKVLWAMEGVSTSSWRKTGDKDNFGNALDLPRYTTGAPWQVRCVRNLGTDLSTVKSTRKADPAYRERPNATRIIEMVNYDSKSVRQEKITKMIPHDIANQDYNRCYKAFEYASTAYNINNCTGYDSDKYWNDYGLQAWLNDANPCDILNVNGATGWRVPNQKETAIMNTLDITPSDGYFYISATFSHYDTKGKSASQLSDLDDTSRTFKVMMMRSNKEGTQRSFSSDDNYITRQIRCVRDVD